MFVEFVLFLVLFGLVLVKFNQKPKGLPPGDWGLPILGVIPNGRKGYDRIIESHERRYGNGVYCLKIGARPCVFITDYTILKNTFSKMESSGRPNFHSIYAFGEQLGISMAVGEVWQTNRRFTVKHLRDFGLGKTSMGSIVYKEVEAIVDYYTKRVGQPIHVTSAINVAVVNGLWAITSGRRYDLEDPRMVNLNQMNRENFDVLQSYIQLLDFYPRTNLLPASFKDSVLSASVLRNNRDSFKKFLMEVIQEHRNKIDWSNEDPDNFIDLYLIDVKNETGKNMEFRKRDENLVHILINFFTGGSDTTANNIKWLCTYLVIHQDIQKKIQDEIDRVIPHDRLPGFEDEKELPYMQAVIQESFRLSSLVRFAIPHATMEDMEIGGYTVPKGMTLFPCFDTIHNSPKLWKKPEQFYPEHFMNEDGTFNGKKDGLVNFSIGKRQCPGKDYARMMIFLVVTALLQRFKIIPAPGVTPTYEADKSSPYFNFPVPYDFIFTKRI